MASRRHVLGGLTVAAGLLAVVILSEVVATVFFAMTVAYVLGPVRRRLRQRGLSRRLSAIITSLAAFLAVVAVIAPLFVVLVVRLDEAVLFVESIPDAISLSARGFEYTVVTADVTAVVARWLIAAGTAIVAAAPVLIVKLALFAFVVYGLLVHERRTHRATLALVPLGHRDLAEALHERASRTLYGLYVVQAATGFATFLIAIPVFVAFGYPSPIALATLAGVLQFVPVLGPSVLVVALAGSELMLGDAVSAVGILVVGGLFIAAAPDLLVRPRLAAETAELPSTLYFIGFVGGVLTVGPVGVIAGPLVVAIVTELATRLSGELNAIPVGEESKHGAADATDAANAANAADAANTVNAANAVPDADGE
ncbi:AI-2E family transporter [Halorubrum sp. JWXQ-INN 858]|uniref:AI-2E family transporter n=1 Tax=Halorubrum sp. JWXQ-INN 858 TaxID=2690782 RepID=UPI00135AE085|nr:AI-2E family transporter [Halorubrum sp. JWXQ-INN 858]MWV63552.1 AI-2E family transporter [Halorubrum sp. JWXQ-INN 858]